MCPATRNHKKGEPQIYYSLLTLKDMWFASFELQKHTGNTDMLISEFWVHRWADSPSEQKPGKGPDVKMHVTRSPKSHHVCDTHRSWESLQIISASY